ncbi:type II toxin-antitoxin system HipA family toxin [Microbacterium sp.]|uniref:type II toxin-antitoxin system HipA family toxin n=2 Tax=Microbacterium sp. TaxID=51671 RepID=UPI00092612FA|nr:HipA domain-containing protein [Microbacterium sp.]MBN9192134.1 HipA domain-containing protein [Microbacterium sp.]OJU56866.1 MAG: hypothetical protein BGO04_04985 [Microbacterium sp. 70-38]
MPDLRVELYGVHVGTLSGERDRIDFEAHHDGLERFGLGSQVMSITVPLIRTTRDEDQGKRRAFFEEVLSEGGVRRTLAANARLDSDNTLGLLARYGRDTAGALQIWNEQDAAEPRIPEARPVTAAEVKTMFQEVKLSPLGNAGRRRVSSLAGVQDKVLLVRTLDGWAEPLDGYPSTHIIKPINTVIPSLIFDEEYGSRFVRALNLAAFSTTIEVFDGASALVIERFDRDREGGRIHQEDFNQALGHIGDAKYEQPHETDRLRRIAEVLRSHAGSRDLQNLLRMTALSVVLHNYDMHAKNIGLLHYPDGDVVLAPMYDVIPSAHLNVDQSFALAVNGKREADEITLADVAAEGRSWGIRQPERIVAEVAEAVVETARVERPHPAAHGGLDHAVENAAQRMLDEFADPPARTPAGSGARPARRTSRRLGETARGGAPGSFAETEHSAPEVWLPKQPPGGWGGPAG